MKKQYNISEAMSLDNLVKFMNSLPENAEIIQIVPLGITGAFRVVYATE